MKQFKALIQGFLNYDFFISEPQIGCQSALQDIETVM